MTVLWTPFKKIISYLKFIVIKSLENSEIYIRVLLKTALKKLIFQKTTRMSGNRVLGYPKKLLDTRPSTRNFKSRVIWKLY
jgi:hypothetical protein